MLWSRVVSLHAQAQSTGYDLLRVENEYKIDVPAGEAGRLWNFLQRTFVNDPAFLRALDSTITARTATDRSTDQYFDNTRMQLLLDGNGVRHRSRLVLSDTTDLKNGRQLVQVKIDHVDDKTLDRAEFKYPVAQVPPDTVAPDRFDHHPFLGRVAREQRPSIMARLRSYGIAADSLFPTILIEQSRQRIYVDRGDTSFATVTLDSVRARFGERMATYVELELELNEKVYTASDPSARARMERFNAWMKDTIMHAFPMLHQDQTSKYRKAYDRMGLDGFGQDHRTRNAWPLVGGGALTIVITVLAARRRRRNLPL